MPIPMPMTEALSMTAAEEALILSEGIEEMSVEEAGSISAREDNKRMHF